MSKKWLAIYTRPRWEKKVDLLLRERGVESYCPLNKIRRRWSDRVKLIEEPLFKSYVFVRTDDQSRTQIRMTPGVINFVYWDGRPAVIRDREIQAIRRFLDEYENVEVYAADFRVNERVKVLRGPLMDLEGNIVDIRHKMVKVAIDSLGYVLVAYIERSKLSSAAN